MVDAAGVSLSLVAALSLGVTSIFVRLGTKSGKSTDVLMFTFLVNIILVLPITAVVHYPDYGLTPLAVFAFTTAGVTGTLCGRALFYRSIESIGASRTEPVKATQPLHAAIVAAVVLGEALTVGNFVGITLIVVGLFLVSREIVKDTGSADDIPVALLLVPLGAAFFFGIEPTFAKIGFAEETPVLVGLLIKTAAAALGTVFYLRWRDDLPSFSRSTLLENGSIKWYLLAGVTNTLFLFTYYTALQNAPVVLVVPIVQMSPLVVVALSLAFLPNIERVTPRLVVAASVIVVGAVVVTLTT